MMYKLKKLTPKFIKKIYHFFWAALSIVRYGYPSKKLIVIGVTGTDGKTTTTEFIYSILQAAGKRSAMINGLRFVLPSGAKKNKSDNSTPGKLEIRKFLHQAVMEDCEAAVLEVTSWGIEQFRVFAIDFDVAVITNLTYEHLDLHGSMEKYKKMKGKLFKSLHHSNKNRQSKEGVVNMDDEHTEYFCGLVKDQCLTYSIKNKNAHIFADNIQEKDCLEFNWHMHNQKYTCRLNMRGEFNVSNALASIGACSALGIEPSIINRGLESVPGVPGRMEFIDKGQDFYVVVDFAHTPNGFKNLFDSARRIVGDKNKIIAVYGSTGGRDKGRRPMVGQIAGELVDFSILTSEDPRTEDPREIARQIETGLKQKGKQIGKDYVFIKDRFLAIKHAVKMANKGDIVLLCSMGDYDIMYVGEKKIKWSDREAAQKALMEIW